MHDLSKTIEELEGKVWPYNSFQSHVVQESQRLRKVPLKELTPAGMRLLITQGIGLEYVVPLALEVLAKAPLIEATFYAGDLLLAVLQVPSEYWLAHSAQRWELDGIGLEIQNIHKLLIEEVMPLVSKLASQNS
jgi:CDI immunity proteins